MDVWCRLIYRPYVVNVAVLLFLLITIEVDGFMVKWHTINLCVIRSVIHESGSRNSLVML